MQNKIFVGNLSWDVDDQALKEAFEQFGTVEEAVVITDRFKNRSKGFGFVTFSSEEEAQAAIAGMDGQEIDGRPVNVSIAKPKSDE